MNGHPEIIDVLNEVLVGELTAINQYFLDAKMFGNWGFESLEKKFWDESMDEMKDADHLIERLLYLDAQPVVQLGLVRVGQAPREKFEFALELEVEAIARLNRGIELCTRLGDNGSRELLESILLGEEEHADWLQTQLDAMDRVGDQLYLSEHLRAS